MRAPQFTWLRMGGDTERIVVYPIAAPTPMPRSPTDDDEPPPPPPPGEPPAGNYGDNYAGAAYAPPPTQPVPGVAWHDGTRWRAPDDVGGLRGPISADESPGGADAQGVEHGGGGGGVDARRFPYIRCRGGRVLQA